MKKITLFVCALATVVAAFATPASKSVAKIQPREIKLTQVSEDGLVPQKIRTAAIDTVVVSYQTNEVTYQVGKPTDGILYACYQMGLVAPYNTSLIFYNGNGQAANGTACTWLVDDAEVATGAWFYKMPVEFDDANPMPLMRVEADGGDTIKYLDFQWSALASASWRAEVSPKFYSGINVAPAEFYPLTNCAMYTEDPRNDEAGDDWGIYGGATGVGTYKFGTKMSNPWDGGLFDSIATFYENPGTMVIDNITLPVFSSTGSVDGMFPSDEDHVRLTIYAQGADGYVDWDAPIASATANKDYYTPADETQAPYYGLLEFDFLSEDPETGIETPSPITVTGNFWIVLDEFNAGSADFGIFSDYYRGYDAYVSTGKSTGNTFFIGFDDEGIYYTGLWVVRGTIMLSLTAFLPAFDAPEEIKFEAAGGTKELDIPSNMWDELTEIEAEDWITATVVTDFETKQYLDEEEGLIDYDVHLYNNKLTVTVGETTEERSGNLIISDISGDQPAVIATIKISQEGSQSQGIEDVYFKTNGKSYNVLGQEVNDEYKGVIIRNGEKFIR